MSTSQPTIVGSSPWRYPFIGVNVKLKTYCFHDADLDQYFFADMAFHPLDGYQRKENGELVEDSKGSPVPKPYSEVKQMLQEAEQRLIGQVAEGVKRLKAGRDYHGSPDPEQHTFINRSQFTEPE